MILIVDDEKYIRSSLSGLLTDEGYGVRAVESAEAAERVIKDTAVDLILLDIQMPGKDGLSFLEDNRDRLASVPVIIISGRGDIPTAIAALKLGAYDYIEKPLAPERVLLTIKQALHLSKTVASEKKLTNRLLDRYQIVGSSQPVRQLRSLIEKAARVDSAVLINGENGTGKELVAHNIHTLSDRKTESFVVVNCPAIPEQLFESELFGHVKGAFTGAASNRDGRCMKADNGTLFLDEIGDLPPGVQAKLLRFLETREFEKVGSNTTLTVDCRLISATNRNLQEMIKDKSFREDLYYRFNIISIVVPPLRERSEDIPELFNHFMIGMEKEDQYNLSSEAAGLLASFDWPGNIRQLKNMAQQIAFNLDPGEIKAGDIDRLWAGDTDDGEVRIADQENRLTATVRQFETGFLTQLHRKHQGNIAAMARELNMDRGNLSKKLRQLNIV